MHSTTTPLKFGFLFLIILGLISFESLSLFKIYHVIYIPLFGILALLALTNRKILINSRIIISSLAYFLILTIALNRSPFGLFVFSYIYLICIVVESSLFNKHDFAVLFLVTTVINLYWFLFSSQNYDQNMAGVLNKSDLEVINSNSVAAIIEITAMINLLFYKMWRKINKPWTPYLIFFISAVGIYNTHSRTALISFGFFFVLFNAVEKNKNTINERKIKVITIALLCLSVVFPFVYVGLMKNETINLLFYQITGKWFFMGREYIYIRFFDEFSKNPIFWLFGVGRNTSSYHLLVEGTLHNAPLVILSYYGIPALLIYFLFIYKGIGKVIASPWKPELKKKLILCVWTITLIGFTETIPVWVDTIPICYFFFSLGQSKKSLFELQDVLN